MAEKFNFKFSYGDYVIIENDFSSKFYDYKETEDVSVTLPKHTILQVDNISMGGQYKTVLFVVFKFLKKNNKHISGSEKIPSKFKAEIYDLNDMEYTSISWKENNAFRDTDVLEKKLNSIIRKVKIENLLTNEA